MYNKEPYNYRRILLCIVKGVFVKLFVLLIFFYSLITNNVFAKDEQDIYITLDISGSMRNSKYIYGNYSAQTLALLNHHQKTTFIIGTIPIVIKDVSKLRQSVGAWNGGWPTEIEDIKILIQKINLSYKNSVFIIGDGHWHHNDTYLRIFDDFKKVLQAPNTKVYFLETLERKSEETPFENGLKEDGISKIYKTHNDNTIIECINTITEEITGVSAMPDSKIKSSGSCYSFTSLLDISKLMILYQDKKIPKDLPKIISLKVDDKDVDIQHIGVSTTQGMGMDKVVLSGTVYETELNIKPNQKVELCFNNKINSKQLKIYPFVEMSASFGLTLEHGLPQTSNVDTDTEIVCDENDFVIVKFKLSQKDGNVLPEQILKEVKAELIVDSQTYHGELKDGQFEFKVPFSKDKITYVVEADIPGYKKIASPKKTVKRSNDCDRSNIYEPNPFYNEPLQLGSVDIDWLKENKCINFKLVDAESGFSLDPHLFAIDIQHKYPFLFKEVKINKLNDNEFELCLEFRDFCVDCLMPKEINLSIEAKPLNNQLVEGKLYQSIITPISFKVEHQQSWWMRCKCFWLMILISGVSIWFFYLLINKKRFRRKSSIRQEQTNNYSLNEGPIYTNYALRRKGAMAWINRWFNPFVDEKNTKGFTIKTKNISFLAHKNTKKVSVLNSTFKDKEISCMSYDEENKDKYLHLDDNTPIQVEYYQDNLQYKYDLTYYYDRKAWDDIKYYNLFLRTLIFIGVIIIFISSYFLIRSLF
ncbi:MAG: hypothetical protein LC105_05960 [Chitinophagales bacterium]|nr:hypothetical protein [Chitinophagales bacterium]